jgi:heme exporter protein D
MANVRITLEIDESVASGIEALIARAEFKTSDGKGGMVPVYASWQDFLARHAVRVGLQQYQHLLPTVAVQMQTIQQHHEAIQAEQQKIESLLTPTVVDAE